MQPKPGAYGAGGTTAVAGGGAVYVTRYRVPKNPATRATIDPASKSHAPTEMSARVALPGARYTWITNMTQATIPSAPARRVSQPDRGTRPTMAISPSRIVMAPADRRNADVWPGVPMNVLILIDVPANDRNQSRSEPMIIKAAPTRVIATRMASAAIPVRGLAGGTAVGREYTGCAGTGSTGW